MKAGTIEQREPTLIDLCLSGDATERQIDAAIDRAAVILGGGSYELIWSALGFDRPPTDSQRIKMARELLDAALEAKRIKSATGDSGLEASKVAA
jgi:hypothetical protein